MESVVDRSFLNHETIARLSRLQVRPRGLMEGGFSGLHRSPHHGASVEFAEYRKYVAGDDIRHIDWRIYAKTDRFYLKQFEADTNLRGHMLLDVSASMAFGGEDNNKFTLARSMAATLAHLLIHQGDHVGLQCFNDKVRYDIRAKGSPRHLANIYDTMAKLEPAGGTSLVTILHDLAEKIKRRAMLIIFSDCFTEVEPLLDCFEHMRFRKHDLTVFHMLDREEIDFQFDRPIRFIDLEDGGAFLTDPVLIQSRYRNLIATFLEELQDGCRRHSVDYRPIYTDQDVETALTPFLLDRMRK